MNIISRMSCIGGALIALFAPVSFGAGEALEEIVVTAERRAESLQDVGVAVSVRTGEELAKGGKYSLDDILENIPGVSGETTGGSSGTIGTDSPGGGIAIRGIQTNDQGSSFYLPPTSATALYVDGIYNGLGGTYDIDRVEVLRGPQGTLYGRSATGGLIATHTRNPELNDFGGNASVLAGNYGLRQYTGALNAPIGGTFALRLSGNHYLREGYEHREGGKGKTTDFRLKALYEPTDSLSVLLGAAMQDNDANTGGIAYRRVGPLTITNPSQLDPKAITTVSIPILTNTFKFRQYWAEINWRFAGMTLTYLPSYRTFEQHGQSVIGGGTFFGKVSVPEDEFMIHELRLTSDATDMFSWQTGVVYFHNDVKGFQNEINSPGDIPRTWRLQDREITEIGGFGEITYSFTDRTALTVGGRFDRTEIANDIRYRRYTTPTVFADARVFGEAGKLDTDSVTYKVRLEHEFAADKMFYAMVSSGFAPGDINITTSNGPPVRVDIYRYDAEELISYELGSKNRFVDGRVQVNVAVYYNDYQGYHTQVFDQNDSTNQFIATIPVEGTGAELESLYQITDRTRLGLNMAYTRAIWSEKPGNFASSAVKDELPDVSPFTASLLVDHDVPLPGGSGLNLHADGNFKQDYDTQILTPEQLNAGAERFIRPGDAWIFNVSANWHDADNHFYVSAYVRNVGDTRKLTTGTVRGIWPYTFAGPNGWTENDVTYSAPRTYGVRVGYQF